MSWRWRKSIGRGPFRINITKRGIGYSVGIPGLRYGRSPTGRKYVSQGIPGTGLYRIKYLGAKIRGRGQTALPPQTTVPVPGPAPAPTGPSPLAIWVHRASAAGLQFVRTTARAVGALALRAWTWSSDQFATTRLRWRAHGWSPPPATPPTAPVSATTPPPTNAPSWLPAPSTTAQPPPPPSAPSGAPPASAAPPLPVDPWWKDKPSP